MIRANEGFTIIELLVAVMLAAVVTSASMGLYITQHKQLIVQDQVADMQGAIRASMAELATNIRMAGYNIPDGMPGIVASNTNPDTIMISFNSDMLNNISIVWPMPQPSSELRCDGQDISGLYDNDVGYILDPFTGTGEFFIATQVQYASSNIQHNRNRLSKRYPAGSKVMKLNVMKYYINQTDPYHPKLMVQRVGRSPEVFADNITGLNLQYVLSSGAIVDVPSLVDMVREVVITVNARNDRADSEFHTSYRTRMLSTRVRVRNLGVN